MKTIALVLNYEESQCYSVLKEFDKRDIVRVDRQGIGSMAKAFNEGLEKLEGKDVDYVWWITNVEFEKGSKEKLEQVLVENPEVGAVHPKFQSDHPHIRFGSGKVPFIEFTAPMFRYKTLIDVGDVDEQMPYWGFDLDWSYRAKCKGWELVVEDEVEVWHMYSRHLMRHPVTDARLFLREYHDKGTVDRLVEKYGPGWRELMTHYLYL